MPRMEELGVFISLLSLLIGPVSSQLVCPMQWEQFEEHCYKFVLYPERSYVGALTDCARDHSALVSVNSITEHTFIKQKLTELDIRKGNWYTSGVLMPNGRFRWDGDGNGVDMNQNGGYWVDNAAMIDTAAGKSLVFQYKNLDYGWARADPRREIGYICEISIAESYKTLQDERGPDYGMDFSPTLSNIDRGPKFLVEILDTLVVGKPPQAYIECVATGKPAPTYVWQKGTAGDITLTSNVTTLTAAQKRYTFTNGRLTFSNPSSGSDAARFQCKAENQYGAIIGNPIQVSFGSLGQFSNVQSSAVRGISKSGAQIECPSITFSPGIRYQWAKDFPNAFVRPDYSKYLFISSNGKLYFSEVDPIDAGYYFCVVSLARPQTSQSYIGSTSMPSATAIKRKLVVDQNAGGQNKPEILDDFIYVSPQNPKRGETVRLECFAYGTLPLSYSWVRIGFKPMPDKARFLDQNRVLELPDVSEDDGGSYRCNVFSSKTRQSDTKVITLSIQAKPYFIIPLKNQFVDKGSQLTWRCYATGTPAATYYWFKNGELIQRSAGEVEVRMNTLVIYNLQEKHNGMYQCAANNQYGTAFTSAQLTVLEFAPTFKKQAKPGTYFATLGGNSTLQCNPEAAPFPTFRWFRNGADLGVTVTDLTSRVHLIPGGDLMITQVQYGDQGTYRCEAENSLGKDSVSGQLVVLEGTTFSQRPSPKTVLVNDTAFFYCRASYNNKLDLIYIWKFNGVPLDIDNNPYFSWGSGIDMGGLYIRNAQFEHEGSYTCLARTQSDAVMATAYLTVNGPPGEPAGVYGVRTSMTSRGMRLKWTPGDNNGSPILTYVLEGSTNFEDHKVWRVLKYDVSAGSAIDTADPDSDKRTTTLTTLTPGTGYKFRVRAQNRFGLGAPSPSSEIYQTTGDKPTKVVEEVGGGGGKVGDLTMTWKPLEPVDHHGGGIGYAIYWRKKGFRITDVDWEKKFVYGNVSRHVHTVGQSNFYSEYEVKIGAFNVFGAGPNSSIQVIYSAEDLPIGTPGIPYGEGFNATCLKIYWNSIEDTKQQVRGKLLGYKINYWKKGVEIEDGARQAILHGQRDNGLIIGLDHDSFYIFNVQAYNTAGNGPKSDEYLQTTFHLPPMHYPTEVSLHSVSQDTVEVNWRGVSTNHGEEPLQGYKIRYWVYGTDIRNASDVDTDRTPIGFVRGLQKNTLYNLRVLAYSRGGDGKMSMPPLSFSMENSQIRYDPGSTELLASSSTLMPSLIAIVTTCLFSLFYRHYKEE